MTTILKGEQGQGMIGWVVGMLALIVVFAVALFTIAGLADAGLEDVLPKRLQLDEPTAEPTLEPTARPKPELTEAEKRDRKLCLDVLPVGSVPGELPELCYGRLKVVDEFYLCPEDARPAMQATGDYCQ